MKVVRHIEDARERSPRQTALLFEGTAYSYQELDTLAGQAAGVLRGLGIQPGDRVALHLPNTPEWVYAYLAILKCGAVAVSMAPALASAEVRTLAADCGARGLITTGELAERVARRALPGLEWRLIADGDGEASLGGRMRRQAGEFAGIERRAEDPAAIVYTSGTTGAPKGAVLTHGNLVFNARSKVRYLGIRAEDRLLLFLPLHHCFGQNAVLNAGLAAGATVVLHRKFETGRVLDSIRADGISMFFGIPATYAILHGQAQPEDLRGVRYFFSAAAPLAGDVERRWQEKFGAVIHQGYGLTETSPFASYNHERRHKPGSVGTPIEGVAIRVVDPETGRELPPGAQGEIVIRGPNVMAGYWGRPEETGQAIRDGWFHSGDIGWLDGDGYVHITDRLKDMINSGGLKVWPAEVEGVLSGHAAVLECAVYGAADAVMGEQVRAAIVRRPGAQASTAEIRAYGRERLADYKIPAAIEFRDALPKTPSGKVLKRVLRDEAAAPVKGARAEIRDAAAWQAWITDWLAARLGVPRSHLRQRMAFADLGVSSILAVQLAREAAEESGTRLEATALWRHPTIELLALAIARLEAGRVRAMAAGSGE